MLSNPRLGTTVRLHYRASLRAVCPHGETGEVIVVGRGRPRNHLVRLKTGRTLVVPVGNLRAESATDR